MSDGPVSCTLPGQDPGALRSFLRSTLRAARRKGLLARPTSRRTTPSEIGGGGGGRPRLHSVAHPLPKCHHAQVQSARGAFFLGLTLFGAASLQCTGGSTSLPLREGFKVTGMPPPSLVSPAPAAARHCLMGPVRAQSVDPAAMLSQLDGHVPTDLPAGFGLLGLWGGLGGADPEGTAIWFDTSCRNVAIDTWASSDPIPDGPTVGVFTLTSGVPPTCATPGPKPCLSYRAHLAPGLVEVDTVGLARSEADAIVRSVA